jgi:hypothetical protein
METAQNCPFCKTFGSGNLNCVTTVGSGSVTKSGPGRYTIVSTSFNTKWDNSTSKCGVRTSMCFRLVTCHIPLCFIHMFKPWISTKLFATCITLSCCHDYIFLPLFSKWFLQCALYLTLNVSLATLQRVTHVRNACMPMYLYIQHIHHLVSRPIYCTY